LVVRNQSARQLKDDGRAQPHVKIRGVAAKLLLLSVVIALIALPLLTARDRNARRGLKKAILLVITFNLLYLFLVRFVYPRLQ
jgi:membrane-associated HD superfamily phosphohydrolase